MEPKNNPFLCNICKKSFSKPVILLNHVQFQHLSKKNKPTANKTSKKTNSIKNEEVKSSENDNLPLNLEPKVQNASVKIEPLVFNKLNHSK